MKLVLLTLGLVCALAGCGGKRHEGLTVLTFNVLCSFCDTKNYDPWATRLDAFQDVLKRHDPDLFGLQEIFTVDEVKQIAGRVPGYGSVYFHDPAKQYLIDYPDATLWYRQSMFEVVESGQYWLSATPDEPWTFGWAGSQFWRIVTWARLRFRDGSGELYAATTHVDNNHPNQDMSAPLILSRSEPWAGSRPVIVMGDFNSTPDTTAYAALMGSAGGFKFSDAWVLAQKHEVLHNQAQPPDYDPAQRIDHIFLAGKPAEKVDRWSVDMYVYGDQKRYPSDHFAISVHLSP